MLSEHFPKESSAPRRARELLGCFDGRVDKGVLADARLLVSEVVSNAVEHVDASGEIGVEVSYEHERLRVEVTDPGDGFAPQARDADSHRGWGLHFVQKLSEDWGVASGPPGRVWFELAG
jgi:anti-sigma regulatory factor (Ser/Thr protein kinase)